MKLVRVGNKDQEKPGVLDQDGCIRDLSSIVADITPDTLSRDSIDKLASIDVTTLPVMEGELRFGAPISGTRQFIAIGLNYRDHAIESNLPIPEEPVMFTKGVSCIQGANDDVRKPRNSRKMDWEVELGIVIGTAGSYIDQEFALDHIAGYCVVDDLSERYFQFDRSGTWDKGKGCPTFGPVGPWLVTPDEIQDVQNLDMWLDVNGERMQTGNTKTMIFDVAYLVHYVSQFMELRPGDIITTGTPPGVGMGMNPPVYLDEGDVIELGITGLGSQRHQVRTWIGDS